MEHAEIQDSKAVSAVSMPTLLSANPPPDPSCIWVAASPPCSSSSGSNPLPQSIALRSNVRELDQPCADKSSPPPFRLEFMQSFANTLLPQLKRIHSQSSSISPQAKFSAVRVAADMSLAVSARRRNNNIWSRALLQELSNSYSKKKAGAMRDHTRYPHSCRRKIYARMLRRRNTRVQDWSCGSSLMGRSSQAYGRARRSSHKSSRGSDELFFGSGSPESRCASNMRCRNCLCVSGVRHASAKRGCGLGLPSYLKVLRNSRVVERAAEPGYKPSKVQVRPRISEEQIVTLGGLVPGGQNMDVPLLLQEAADYILSLQMQVEALHALTRSVSL